MIENRDQSQLTTQQKKLANVLGVSKNVMVTYQFIIVRLIKRRHVVTRATLEDHLVAPTDVAARCRTGFLRSGVDGAPQVLEDIGAAGVVTVAETDVLPAVGLNYVEDVSAITSLKNTKE